MWKNEKNYLVFRAAFLGFQQFGQFYNPGWC